ncbi:MAG: glutamate 5-kinase [Candidatus Binatota bacterium]|nr:glutamate 5-kinase [Candidatus Binatota bacterium]
MTPLEAKRRLLGRARRVVVKIGSSLLSASSGLDRERIRALVGEIEELSARGPEFVLVTSGAVAAGMARLRLAERPKTIPQKQAAAAVGQIDLMAFYEECFAARGRHVAQMLLTRDDLTNRRRYLNAKHTLMALLEASVVPIVNENDTVVVEEIKLGDNDNLSAEVASLAEADWLIILSDVDGLHTADPNVDPAAPLVPLLSGDDPGPLRFAGGSAGKLGTGGMASKLEAARKASAAGVHTLIADGRRPDVLARAFDPMTEIGTLVVPHTDRMASRKHWIAYTLRPQGTLELDVGAVAAVRVQGRSLLPSGVRAIDGTFGAGDCVRCTAPDGAEIARGLVSYSAAELRKIAGAHTRDIDRLLGYKISDEVIHRDDLVVL